MIHLRQTNRTPIMSVVWLAITIAFIGSACGEATDVGETSRSPLQSVSKDYIVKYKTANGRTAVGNSGTIKRTLPARNLAVARLSPQAAMQLAANPHIEYIEPDHPRFLVAESIPYGISMVFDPEPQEALLTPGPVRTRVCVVDTGVYRAHPDLIAENIGHHGFAPGEPANDEIGHGTHVTGTIAATIGNGIGVVGGATDAVAVDVVDVFPNTSSTPVSTVIAGLETCQSLGARVINMSLGGASWSEAEEEILDELAAEGTLVVAAAGNTGGSDIMYPASHPEVISVAAIDENKDVASFSTRNKYVELTAPGVAVESTVLDTVEYLSHVEFDDVQMPSESVCNSDVPSATGILVDGQHCGAAYLESEDCRPHCDGLLDHRPQPDWHDAIVFCKASGSVLYQFEQARYVEINGARGVIFANPKDPTEYDRDFKHCPVGLEIKAMSLSADDAMTLKWRALGDEVTMTDVPVRTVRYESWSGTSMAAPHVTAAAALLWSARPDATREELRTALQLSAEDLGVPGRDHETGFGLVRPTAAIYHLPEAWVCQITERLETSCSDGIDNDCNGDIDDADANCP